jgi:hypothetical protein
MRFVPIRNDTMKARDKQAARATGSRTDTPIYSALRHAGLSDAATVE